MATTKELPILPFASAALWEQWLSKHHARLDGVWIKMAKKASGIASVVHDEALDVALCYGWIDEQRKAYDGNFFPFRRLRLGGQKVCGQSVMSAK